MATLLVLYGCYSNQVVYCYFTQLHNPRYLTNSSKVRGKCTVFTDPFGFNYSLDHDLIEDSTKTYV